MSDISMRKLRALSEATVKDILEDILSSVIEGTELDMTSSEILTNIRDALREAGLETDNG